MTHCIDPEGCIGAQVGERFVDVDNRPTREIAAEGKRPGDKTVEAGFLADLVDHAAGGAAAKEDGRRPFQNLDFLKIERVTIVVAEVAQAVQEDVAAGDKASDRWRVAHGAEFACSKGDAGHRSYRVVEVGYRTIFELLARNGVDRLRYIDERNGELRQ